MMMKSTRWTLMLLFTAGALAWISNEIFGKDTEIDQHVAAIPRMQSAAGIELSMLSVKRCSVQHQTNNQGRQMFLEISDTLSTVQKSPNGLILYHGLSSIHMLNRSPSTRNTLHWNLYEEADVSIEH